MQELVPFISCLATPAEFPEAIQSTYSEVYVKSGDGYLKHMKLRGGRHIRLKIDGLPKGLTQEAVEEIDEEINFLPDGKIPFEYFEQIKCFFKEVMRLKKADYEAHAWILWSKEKGYYISVPKQTVSKASVTFTYDQDALPADSIIVVDLHSHNTMGAFYSGTDNNNDKNGIYYSGVIGRLDTEKPQVVMRFNMHEVKKEVKLDEIFEIPKKEVIVPKEWIDQVEVKAFSTTPPPVYGGMSNFRNQPSLWDQAHNFEHGAYRRSLVQAGHGYMDPDLKALIDAQEEALNEAAEEHLIGHSRSEVSGGRFPRTEASQESIIIDNSDDDDAPLERSEDYDYNVATYGKDAAEAKDLIDACLDSLAEKDELLMDILRSAYDMLSENAQAQLQTNGI